MIEYNNFLKNFVINNLKTSFHNNKRIPLYLLKPQNMRQSKPTQRQSLKLPAIGNKTMDSIYRQSQQLKKQRPLSSKNVVGDLQKRLFSQLQAYQQKSQTMKLQKHLKTKSTKTTINSNNEQSVLMASSCKDISNHHNKLNTFNTNISDNPDSSDSMQKIAKLMPQLYSKILQSKKGDEVKPLKQVIGFNDNGEFLKAKQQKVQQKRLASKYKVNSNMNKQSIQQPKLSTRTVTQNPKKVSKLSSTPSSSLQQQPGDSFSFAQQQIDNIYRQYLQSQGLSNQPQTSSKQLQSMNIDLQRCQVDIQQLQKNYSNLIKQLGNLCVRQIE